MKHQSAFIILICTVLAGCESFPQPTPGLASIRIHVMAEPKTGSVLPDGSSVYDSPGRREADTGNFQRVDYPYLDEIVVWIEPVIPSPQMKIAAARIDVAVKKPAVAIARAVSVHQPLTLHNTGTEPAVFYSVSDGNEFDLGSIPAGGQKNYTVRSAGLIEILTDTAIDPVAEVYAAPSSPVSLGHSGGEVDFLNVPPGRYKIASWHPRLPGSETVVTLSPNQIAVASIKVGVNGLPKIGPQRK